MTKIRWGVLSTAAIASEAIPAMNAGKFSVVTAIASRDISRARQVASELGIAKAYGSYEELLADADIDAIYNLLPNHLHVPWSLKAIEAGKHVLCEKPFCGTAEDAKALLQSRDQHKVKVGEGFMFRCHPQWHRTRQLVESGKIGTLRAISGHFSYYNVDVDNIRNKVDCGGGALMDVGCYLINACRFLFNQEPLQAMATMTRDQELGTDTLTSAVLNFPAGEAHILCSTQLTPYQYIHLFGTEGRISIETPFNAPPDRSTRLIIKTGNDFFDDKIVEERFPACNQHTLQGDAFSEAVLGDTQVPVPLEDAEKNAAVIQAIVQSAAANYSWQSVC